MMRITADSTAQRSDLREAIEAASARLITMVTNAPDVEVTVPDTPDWTVRQLFAHVVTVAPRYTAGARQAGRWVDDVPDLAVMNRDEIRQCAHLDVTSLAGQLRGALEELFAVVDSFGSQAPEFRFHGGAKVGADVALGILLGELEVHGHDMARALGQPWHIDPGHARLIIAGGVPILPGWVNPVTAAGHTATYQIRVRGGATHTLSFRDGRLRVAGDLPRPDVVLSVDPVAFLLVFYRRRSQWPEIMRGRMLAWGRRPWLALSLAGRFHTP